MKTFLTLLTLIAIIPVIIFVWLEEKQLNKNNPHNQN